MTTALTIRERPPLRLHVDVTSPNGSHRRWARDEPRPENVPANLAFGSEAPGGFTSLSCTLPRRPNLSYPDTKRLSNVRVMGAGGQVAWEGRLESTPRVAGTDAAINPQCVGWQAHLDDDQSARMIYVDRDFNSWEAMSSARRLSRLNATFTVYDPIVESDISTGAPGLATRITAPWTLAEGAATYNAHGLIIGSLYYAWKRTTNVGAADANWVWAAFASTDDVLSSTDSSGNLRAAGPGTGTLTATSSNKKFLYLQHQYNAASATPADYEITWTNLNVYGNHGLTKRGTEPAAGFYASDIVAHAVRTWAPLLNLTTGANGSVTDTSFIIPQLVFRDPTTAGQIISAANRFHLRDWAVWENKTFYYYDRGARGKAWRARVAPAQLEEAGPSIENLWNGVIVTYQDVDGTTRTVGPTGSSADTISTSVMDTDPLNPANELGIKRWAILDMGGVSTAAGATEVGRRFLVETAQFNTSGRAQLVGHVEDDRGVLYPAWRVRAGDTVSFVDAAYTDPRRVVRTSYSDDSKTNSIDLDAPAEGLEALLQRLQVVLVGEL